jgi:hypothetical protein
VICNFCSVEFWDSGLPSLSRQQWPVPEELWLTTPALWRTHTVTNQEGCSEIIKIIELSLHQCLGCVIGWPVRTMKRNMLKIKPSAVSKHHAMKACWEHVDTGLGGILGQSGRLVKKNICILAGNQTPVVEPLANYFSGNRGIKDTVDVNRYYVSLCRFNIKFCSCETSLWPYYI